MNDLDSLTLALPRRTELNIQRFGEVCFLEEGEGVLGLPQPSTGGTFGKWTKICLADPQDHL